MIFFSNMIPGKEFLLAVIIRNRMLNEQILKSYQHSASKSDTCAVFQLVTYVLSEAYKMRSVVGPKDVCSDP